MNRSFWITLTVSAAVCTLAVIAQSARTSSLQERLAEERARAALESRQEAEARELRASDPPGREPSMENIEGVLAEVVALQPNVLELAPILSKTDLDTDEQLKIDYSKIEAEYLKIFPDFLRSVQGLSVEELLAVAQGIPAPESGNSLLQPKTKTWLLLLAAEQDPLRIYRDETLLAGTSKKEILEILGRENPAAVLKLLPPMKKQTGEPSSSGRHLADMLGDWVLPARIRAGTKLLGSDLDQGLKVLSKVHDNYGYIPAGCFGTMGNTPVPEEAIPGLIDAMGREEYAGMRDDLIEMTLRDTVFKSGVEAAARRVETMQLTEDELNAAIRIMVNNDIMEADPVPMIDWIAEDQPDGVPAVVLKWAETDMEAATDWLVQQEPSPVRDTAIARFATEASKLDRDAAEQWAREIQDEKMREQTLRRINNK